MIAEERAEVACPDEYFRTAEDTERCRKAVADAIYAAERAVQARLAKLVRDVAVQRAMYLMNAPLWATQLTQEQMGAATKAEAMMVAGPEFAKLIELTFV